MILGGPRAENLVSLLFSLTNNFFYLGSCHSLFFSQAEAIGRNFLFTISRSLMVRALHLRVNKVKSHVTSRQALLTFPVKWRGGGGGEKSHFRQLKPFIRLIIYQIP